MAANGQYCEDGKKQDLSWLKWGSRQTQYAKITYKSININYVLI